jgi:Leucine Rich repeat
LQANRTLRELNLSCCRLGDGGIRIIADAIVGNTTIEILDISANKITPTGLDDITRILESTRIQKIDFERNRRVFGNEASTRRFACVLSRHAFLKNLRLCICRLGDKGIRIIADALVGNIIMEIFDIGRNRITSAGLADITRLLESTQLKSINFWDIAVFNDENATQHFVTTLQHKKSAVQKLPGINEDDFYLDGAKVSSHYNTIINSLSRNRQLNSLNLLLAPPPPPLPQQQQQRNVGTMMLKISHKAIAKFAMVANNAGASAIFKLFQARPAVLEKRLKRPAPAVPTGPQNDGGGIIDNNNSAAMEESSLSSSTIMGGPKRQRL